MARRGLPWQNTVVISGDVVLCHFRVELPNSEIELDLLNFLVSDDEAVLKYELRETAKGTLGPEFDIGSLSFRRGSIEIIAMIKAAYYVVSKYKNFIDSIQLACSQMKRVVERFFQRTSRQPVTVTATWSPGAALAAAEAQGPIRPLSRSQVTSSCGI